MSDAELVRNGLNFYRELTKSHVSGNEECQTRIAHAMAAQALALKGDLMKLAKSELAVLEAIKESNKSKDPQVLARIRASIGAHEARSKEPVPLLPSKPSSGTAAAPQAAG